MMSRFKAKGRSREASLWTSLPRPSDIQRHRRRNTRPAQDIAWRDDFAGRAMQQLIAKSENYDSGINWECIAQDAYTMADAMIRESERLRDADGRYLPDPSENIEALGLTQRTTGSLKQAEIDTIHDLLNHTGIELLKKPNLGMRGLREIEARTEGYGGIKFR